VSVRACACLYMWRVCGRDIDIEAPVCVIANLCVRVRDGAVCVGMCLHERNRETERVMERYLCACKGMCVSVCAKCVLIFKFLSVTYKYSLCVIGPRWHWPPVCTHLS
jgi:hypothetical protein